MFGLKEIFACIFLLQIATYINAGGHKVRVTLKSSNLAAVGGVFSLYVDTDPHYRNIKKGELVGVPTLDFEVKNRLNRWTWYRLSFRPDSDSTPLVYVDDLSVTYQDENSGSLVTDKRCPQDSTPLNNNQKKLERC